MEEHTPPPEGAAETEDAPSTESSPPTPPTPRMPWPNDPNDRTPEQQAWAEGWDATRQWLHEKWNRSDGQLNPCPYCGSRNWAIGLPTQFLTLVQPGLVGMFPVVPITCLTCANTVLINAQHADLVRKPKEQ